MALGGQDDVVAASPQRLGEDLFGLARAIGVSRVDEVDARVERSVGDSYAIVVVRVPPRAEHHGSEAELADLDAGVPKRSVVHGAGA